MSQSDEVSGSECTLNAKKEHIWEHAQLTPSGKIVGSHLEPRRKAASMDDHANKGEYRFMRRALSVAATTGTHL
eukprot:1153461-Pelagomonas_calceolata.AAC.2